MRGVFPLHIPVLYNEILSGLRPRAGGRYVDGTAGAGGHASGILDASEPDGQLLGMDRDPAALAQARMSLSRYGSRAILVQASYLLMEAEAARLGWNAVDGALLDLGLSTMQLDDPARGFSFQHDGPLDMRFDPAGPTTAADLVNGLPVDELADLLFKYGEERQSRRIARAIARARPVRGTAQLAEIVARARGGRRGVNLRRRGGRGETHPATQTFQALRIAVNEELEALQGALPAAIRLLGPGGRLAVITFHSLEDRIVKEAFRSHSRVPAFDPNHPWEAAEGEITAKLVNPKPIVPRVDEISRNPRARSAKLRIVEKIR